MYVLDTNVLVYDALDPSSIPTPVRGVLDRAEREGTLACSDISLWEVAMLLDRGRIGPVADPLGLLRDLVDARAVRVVPISPEIARLSTQLGLHGDPADRIVAATAVHLGASLITADRLLRSAPAVRTLW